MPPTVNLDVPAQAVSSPKSATAFPGASLARRPARGSVRLCGAHPSAARAAALVASYEASTEARAAAAAPILRAANLDGVAVDEPAAALAADAAVADAPAAPLSAPAFLALARAIESGPGGGGDERMRRANRARTPPEPNLRSRLTDLLQQPPPAAVRPPSGGGGASDPTSELGTDGARPDGYRYGTRRASWGSSAPIQSTVSAAAFVAGAYDSRRVVGGGQKYT